MLRPVVRAVTLDACEFFHTLASNTHPLGALEGPAAELQPEDAAPASRVESLIA